MTLDPPPTPAVTVTTVLYNSADTLESYAKGLEPGLRSGFLRVVAVDNASPDRSATFLRRRLPGASVIANDSNRGFAAGCNSAWPSVTTRYWLLLNPDVQADPDGIERLVRWMDSRPDVGVASPLLRSPDGRELPVARPPDSLWRPIIEALRLHKLLPNGVRSRLMLAGGRERQERIRGWIPGTALIARAEAVRATGLLDERLFMYGEDVEWCSRMRDRGWAVGVCSEVQFLHDLGKSARKTWGEQQVAREVTGQLTAIEASRGRRWRRAFALVTALALAIESIDPRRSAATRAEARRRGRLYLRGFRRRPAEPAAPRGGTR
jgi:GT2 family glycosyltransferase